MERRFNSPGSPPPRQTWIDAARAVALVLVIIGHTERGLVAAGIVRDADAADFDRVIYSFHIPLFFLISGLVFAHSIQRRPFIASWKSRMVRLLQPYILWSIVLLGLIALAASQASAPVSPGDALVGILLLPLQPVSIFWFLYTLLLCIVVSGSALEHFRFSPAKLLLWSIVIHLAYLAWLSDRQSGPGLQFVRFAEHQLYFAIGCCLAPSLLNDKMRIDARLLGPLAVLMAIVAGVAAALLVKWDLSYHSAMGTLAALSASAAILSVCYLVTKIWDWPVPRGILKISTETLAIFCMHVPFIAAARMLTSHIGNESAALHLLIGTGAGLAGPLVALGVIDRMGLTRIAGFGDSRWAAQEYARRS